jgi:hypothetical protein
MGFSALDDAPFVTEGAADDLADYIADWLAR